MRLIRNIFLWAIGATLLVSCNSSTYSGLDKCSIENPLEAREVAFEDVAKDIKIVPLVCDEPLDRCSKIKCYGQEVLILSGNKQNIYYFNEGENFSKLFKQGRGRGEYLSIADYVYSPDNKVLYVYSSDNGSIFLYSVPDMRFIRSFDIDQITSFAVHNDQYLIARFTKDNKIGFVDVTNGKKVGTLKEITGFSGTFNTEMDFYRPNHRILSEIGSTNIISEVPEQFNKDEKVLFSYDFGEHSIPGRYDDCTQFNIMKVLEFGQYVRENPDNSFRGGLHYQIIDGTISFWYQRFSSDGNKFDMSFFKTNGEEYTLYKGFRAAGFRFPIIPDCVTDEGFVTVLEGSSDFLIDNNQEQSAFSENIKQTMNSQNMNNPVLIYYRIQ